MGRGRSSQVLNITRVLCVLCLLAGCKQVVSLEVAAVLSEVGHDMVC